MLSGSVDAIGLQELASPAGEQGMHSAPVAGVSTSSPASTETSGAAVELDLSAIASSGGVSATDQARQHPQSQELRSVGSSQDHAVPDQAATQLRLSPEALRRALIPAQTMDEETLQTARAEAKVAREALNANLEATPPPQASLEIEPGAQGAHSTTSSTALSTETPLIFPTNVPETRTSQSTEVTLSPGGETGLNSRAGESTLLVPEVVKESPVSTRQPDLLNSIESLQTPSAFESSAPGSTGQSLDIVVGEMPAL